MRKEESKKRWGRDQGKGRSEKKKVLKPGSSKETVNTGPGELD